MDDEMTQMFGFLAGPLGFLMQLIYRLIPDYGVTIIVFTVLIRLLMFPLSMKQQKSQTRMAAFQPMIQEIQKKWANDKNRQQQEVMKFQEENNLKMTGGCLPMIVNMIVLFGMIAVIQAPMQYMLNMTTTQISDAVAIVNENVPGAIAENDTYSRESILLGYFQSNPEWFLEGTDVTEEVAISSLGSSLSGSLSQAVAAAPSGTETVSVTRHTSFTQEEIDKVNGFNFRFLGMNLAAKPALEDWVSWIFPVLSILTMLASQVIVMKTSGQTQGQGQMWIMTLVMGAFFGYFAFTIPAGFSLYYTVSNVVMTIQQLVVRRIYDPAKVKEEIEQEIEERKKAKKAKKTITQKDAKGNLVTKEISDADLNRLRLERARQMDEEKYSETEEERKKANEMAEKTRKLDEEKFDEKDGIVEVDGPPEAEALEDLGEELAEELAEEKAAAQEEAEEILDTLGEKEDKEYKPGRRRRARQNKEKQDEKGNDDEEA